MRLFFFAVLTISFTVSLGGCVPNEPMTLSSPDKQLSVHFQIDHKNSLIYSITKNKQPVILESDLGIAFTDSDFTQGVTLGNISKTQKIRDTYLLTSGKKSNVDVLAHQKIVQLINHKGQKLDVILRLSNDGLGIRYVSDENFSREFITETTSVNFDLKTRAWLQPIAPPQTGWAKVNPSYEEHYLMDIPVGTDSPTGAGWVFPALFKTPNAWVVLSESDIQRNWHVSRLAAASIGGEYKIVGPTDAEAANGGKRFAHGSGRLVSPWRTIAIGDLSQVMESTLVTDLATPQAERDWSWVKPGHSAWSWVLLKDENTTFDVQKQFIDYAAAMQWEYVLIDAQWDEQIGEPQLKQLIDYAAKKNVGIWVWYNSAGDWNETHQTPRGKLLESRSRIAEFARMQALGVKGLKIDFFAGDSQSMMAYYFDLIEAAADHKLMLNFHGATLPRGLQRTFPHLLTVEAIRGFEFTTFAQADQDVVATHVVMAAFARNLYDDMDYTPMVFADIPNIQRNTSNSFELAQSVLFISGVQHFAEIPSGMQTVPDFVKRFLQTLPTQWDDVKFIDGVPGEFIVIARKSSNGWYITGVNASTESRSISLDAKFTGGNQFTLISSGDTDRDFSETTGNLKSIPTITLDHAEGFVMHVR